MTRRLPPQAAAGRRAAAVSGRRLLLPVRAAAASSGSPPAAGGAPSRPVRDGAALGPHRTPPDGITWTQQHGGAHRTPAGTRLARQGEAGALSHAAPPGQ
jgi:hypothetical protein